MDIVSVQVFQNPHQEKLRTSIVFNYPEKKKTRLEANDEVPPGINTHNTKDRRIRRRVRRQQRTTPSVSLHFSIPSNVRLKLPRPFLTKVLVRALLSHTLYSRGVIPCPIQEVLRVVTENHLTTTTTTNGTTHNRQSKSSGRKARKTGAEANNILMEWDQLMDSAVLSNEISKVMISLGPSWLRQRELYLLRMEGLGQDTGHSYSAGQPTPTPAQGSLIKAEHVISRKFLTQFMNTTNDREVNPEMADAIAHPPKSASSYKAFISFLLPRSILERESQLVLSQGLRIRHDFNLDNTLGPKRNRPLSVEIDCTVSGQLQQEAEYDSVESTNSLVWVSLQHAVRGFRVS